MDDFVSRRRFLGGLGALGGAGSLGLPLRPPARADRYSLLWSPLVGDPVHPGLTTLERSILRPGSGGYGRLSTGPAWPTVVRNELAALSPARADSRTPLATVVHLTDIHVIDAQSSGRVEFLDELGDPFTAAFRAQETLTAHVASAMVSTLNSIGVGPQLGRSFDCAVSTGDNIDNCRANELDWFVTVLDGGRLVPNSGDPSAYEGVQAADWADQRFWHPDGSVGGDKWLAAGYPLVPGLLGAAILGFDTPSLSCPWYSTYGNHDGLIQGNVAGSAEFDALLTGGSKVESVPSDLVGQFLAKVFGDISTLALEIAAGVYPSRSITPDASRRFLTTDAWVERHLASPSTPGPVGHGFGEEHFELPGLFYEFAISAGVVGLVLDTGGHNSGSIGELQLQWLKSRLEAHSSHFVDVDGRTVRTANTDQLVVVFSHFPASSLRGSTGDPARPEERRVLGPELESTLLRFDNVVAWINGHHHTNRVTPRPDPSGINGGYWDINTCSHVDWPQQARIVEIADNGDGTLSIFSTLVDHDAPLVPSGVDGVATLAAWSRELAANDAQSNPEARLGPPEARNVELGRKAPAWMAMSPAVPAIRPPIYTG